MKEEVRLRRIYYANGEKEIVVGSRKNIIKRYGSMVTVGEIITIEVVD